MMHGSIAARWNAGELGATMCTLALGLQVAVQMPMVWLRCTTFSNFWHGRRQKLTSSRAARRSGGCPICGLSVRRCSWLSLYEGCRLLAFNLRHRLICPGSRPSQGLLHRSRDRTCTLVASNAGRSPWHRGLFQHRIAINTWQGHGAPPPPEGTARMRHFEMPFLTAEYLEAVVDANLGPWT